NSINIRDLKIRGRDKLQRLPEVNLHNEACAHEARTRVLAVLVSPRTPFSLFCRRLENPVVWSSFHDEMCREIMVVDPFTGTKKSPVARGKKREEVAENLNQIEAVYFTVDKRAVRDRYNLLAWLKN
ncbi:unnamed protein product, partial [Porites lobata]